MIRIDADDAAPRAFTDERTEAVELKAVAENVTVRAGKLIRDCNDRATHGFRWIRYGFTVAWNIVADPLAREFLQQQRRNVSASIETYVDDQSLSIELTEKSPVEFGKSPRAHVGN